MKFKKVILANWANIPNQEYDLSDLVFLTGETGVGKSTMLDAIQTLMTANKKGIVLYNAGQDEAQNKKRNKEYRTIQGYFAGEDRFKFSRPNGCRSTIVLSFQNSINEEKYEFSALITGVVSFEESKGEKRPILDSLKFFIIKSHEILQEDLIDENKQLLNHKELYKNLSLKYDKDNVIHCQDKSDYLNTLYGNLWGKNRTTSLLADKAARAFSNFIHARPVDNINAFVRNEFLSSKDMKDEVNALSSTIRSLDKLKKDAKEIEDSINILESLENKTNVIVRKWHSLGEEHFIYNHYEVLKVENKMIQDEKKYEKIRREIVRLENKEKKLDLDSVNFNEKLLELEIAKNSNDKIKELNDIEKKLQDTKKAFNIGTSNVIRIISNIENISRDTASIFLYREKFENLTRLLNELKIVLDEFIFTILLSGNARTLREK
ncbi:MAG: AAA family ATPase [Campylobacteraceae bacterium]|nr:AAA family ATPase [Campylobacteraceae bacterium]